MTDETMDATSTGNQTAVELTQTPNSIFRRALIGGYKTHDVDHYVDRAAEALETLIEDNKQLRIQLDEMHQAEIAMRTALASALKFSDGLVDAARRESGAMIENIRIQTKRFDSVDKSAPSTLSQEIEFLRAHRDRLAAELSMTLDSHIRLLDTIESNSMSDASRAKAQQLLELAEPPKRTMMTELQEAVEREQEVDAA